MFQICNVIFQNSILHMIQGGGKSMKGNPSNHSEIFICAKKMEKIKEGIVRDCVTRRQPGRFTNKHKQTLMANPS